MCTTPVTINKGTPDQMTVGCGRCMPCHLKYCNQWAFRMNIHANVNPIVWCITLTYTDKNELIVKGQDGKYYESLSKSHIQTFFKKLRFYHDKRYKNGFKFKISYFVAGEYGDKFKRPHYHAIIFGAHPDDILKAWERGLVYFGKNQITETVNYTLKYSLKSKIWKKFHTHTNIQRPFILMSKGIGASAIKGKKTIQKEWLNKNTGEIETELVDIYTQLPEIVTLGKIKTSLPRYYQKKTGQKVDTEEFKNIVIEKQKKQVESLNRRGITLEEYKKRYAQMIWTLNKKQMYNPEVYKKLTKYILDD